MTAANERPAAAEDNLRQAYAYLTGELEAPAVGSIGWCFGGGWSLTTALQLPDCPMTVIYYGHRSPIRSGWPPRDAILACSASRSGILPTARLRARSGA
jgi:carboxymethylenebutenolidase